MTSREPHSPRANQGLVGKAAAAGTPGLGANAAPQVNGAQDRVSHAFSSQETPPLPPIGDGQRHRPHQPNLRGGSECGVGYSTGGVVGGEYVDGDDGDGDAIRLNHHQAEVVPPRWSAASPMSISPDPPPRSFAPVSKANTAAPAATSTSSLKPPIVPSSQSTISSASSSSMETSTLIPSFPTTSSSFTPSSSSSSKVLPGLVSSGGSSAASMIRAASQAGLHSVSSALATQAAQIQAGMSESESPRVNGNRATITASGSSDSFRPRSSPHRSDALPFQQERRPSSNAEYSAAMKAHLTSALRGAEQLSLASTSTSNTSLTGAGSHSCGPPSMAVQTQMAEIATRTAAEEAERQLRVQALLRVARANGGINDDDEHSTSSLSAPSSGPSRLEAVGLGHIALPSQGLEQSWGRMSGRGAEDDVKDVKTAASGRRQNGAGVHRPARFYDATDAMAGVPSLPLMPSPAPALMDAPSSPMLDRLNLPYPHKHRASSSPISPPPPPPPLAQDKAGAVSNEPRILSFEVVQTPGGTAQAGWWLASDEGDGRPGEASAEPSASSGPPASSSSSVYFKPGYTLDGQAYAALATQAAYATSLLTTTVAPQPLPPAQVGPQPVKQQGGGGEDDDDSQQSGGPSAAWQPLEPAQQEAIASQLRAWAGLQGPQKQAEARQSLEDRQRHLASQRQSPIAGAAATAADPNEASQADSFFPPDFASHYRAQLQSLAQGYYQQLHLDGLNKSHYAQGAEVRHEVGSSSGGARQRRRTSHATVDASEADTAQLSAAVAARTKTLGVPADSVAAVLTNAAEPPPPVPAQGAQDPMQLLTAASQAAGVDARAGVVLDQLLRFAHALYQTGNQSIKTPDGSTATQLHPTLLPLLHTLHNLHPHHLPTLLLLSCAYYSAGDLPASLYWNDQILSIDPHYVEAMSNIGTTLRSLGRWKEAESWWHKAIRLRPGYYDAAENLLGVLCSPAKGGPEGSGKGGPRWDEALKLCEHVESHVLALRPSSSDDRLHKLPNTNGSTIRKGDEPLHLPRSLNVGNLPRLQGILYAKGNLKFALMESGIPAARDYMRAVELVVSTSESRAYSCRDLVTATCVAGIVSTGVMLPGSAAASAAVEMMHALALDPSDPQTTQLATSGQWSRIAPGGLLALVHSAGDNLVKTMLRLGGGQLPMVMLLPEPAMKITHHLFDEYQGRLPSLVAARRNHREAHNPKAVQQCVQTTSTIFLTLSKLFQDATANPAPSQHGVLTLGGIPPSTSLLLPLYYLALALNPSASTCNNLGILLSGLPVVTVIANSAGQPQTVNGQGLAMCYYQAGISMDNTHPHLYTNLGSLLKDLGHLKEAIQNYEKAVHLHPTFDVALANLGNSLRDASRTEEALPYYRRALAANPSAQMPEAMCGLLNGLLSLSDWDEAFAKPNGLLYQTAALVEKQLSDGARYGSGALQASNSLQNWLRVILVSIGDGREEVAAKWAQQLKTFFGPLDRSKLQINEGGFVIRLIEHLHKRSQRRWYREHYGQVSSATSQQPRIQPTQGDVARYPKINLPSALVTPMVPTVLPFHTFSYGIEGIMSARAIRLISHRNGLRISQTSLSQPWLPPHVYPPPPPPAPKIRVGYVSSDFNNHPLAHLMQSVFGFHDAKRFEVFLYATTASDNSPYRKKIEGEAQHFYDVSAYSTSQIIDRVLHDGIHILMNLNGYTKGARNEVFAARPCPVQMQFMGFAGGMASSWTDYTVADEIVCPPEVTAAEQWRQRRTSEGGVRPTDLPGDIDPEESSNAWMYTERFIYMPHSYFVNDHKQGFREPELRRSDLHGGVVRPHEMSHTEAWAEEEERRWKARKELFPGLPDDFVVFATFNQIYKIEPVVFRAWLDVLQRVPNSILWLLRFPAAGEPNILRTAREWAGDEVCSRIVFTDVAPKEEHIRRGRVADLFLDTFEVNAHTTACDCLWSGTPILTLPKWKAKQASLVAASIARATGYGEQMIVGNVEEYVTRAVEFAQSVRYEYVGAEGEKLEEVAEAGASIAASELTRVGASAQLAAQAQQQAQAQAQDQAQAQAQSRAANGGSSAEAPVPAPVSAAPQKVNDTAKLVAAAVAPSRESIRLPIGPQAPSSTFTRRGSGQLLELRRNLFLHRDTMPLFDTEGWVRDLERGYEEAWRRWALGTDVEESQEWDALQSEDERAASSGHIFVGQLGSA